MDIGRDLGLSPRAGLLCLPTLSTHGYEVIARTAISQTADILVEYVVQPRRQVSPVVLAW